MKEFIKCPCGIDAQSDKVFTIDEYNIMECSTCSHRFVCEIWNESHVEEVYSDTYFLGGGDGYSDYFEESRILYKHGLRYAKMLSDYMPSGELLDIGSAAGFILQGFVDSGWKGTGVEPNLSMAKFASEELHLEVYQSSFESFTTDLQYDLITMIQVIPHFYDLKKALHKLTDLLKPQGYILVEVWNKNSITAKIFGRNWHEYSPPSVLHWFSPKSLEHWFQSIGFERVAFGRPQKYIKGAHARSLLTSKLSKFPFSSYLKQAVDLIPKDLTIRYPAEDLLWMLFKRSLNN